MELVTTKAPKEVFQDVLNVREWWSGYHSEEFEGSTEKLNDEFGFSAAAGAHYSKQKLVELIPGKRIVWLVTDSDFDYIKKRDEWTGTKLIFEISKEIDKTKLTFTHQGLTPEVECYNSCAPSWTQYLQNKLLPLINEKQSVNE
jgi:hypothetical protein